MKRSITVFAASVAIAVAMASGNASAYGPLANPSLVLCHGALAAADVQGNGSVRAALQLAARRGSNCRNVCDAQFEMRLRWARTGSDYRRAQHIHVNCIRNCIRRGY